MFRHHLGTPSQTSPQPPHYSTKAHQTLRRRLKSEAERLHGMECEWHGGILYFKGTKNAVPDVQTVPKPGHEAVGIDGAHPKAVIPVKTSHAANRGGRAYHHR